MEKIQFKVKPNKIAKAGTALNFIIIDSMSSHLLYQKIPELLDRYYYRVEQMNQFILAPLLFNFNPNRILYSIYLHSRFYQIFKGTHDTFE